MSAKWTLPKEHLKALEKVAEDLRSFVEEERGAFDEMSERWQEGDRGAEVSYWLDHLDELADAIDCVQQRA